MLVRIVSRPLRQLVKKVRQVGRGKFKSSPVSFGSVEFDFLSTEINAMSESLAASERERKIRLDKARKIQENLLPPAVNIPGVRAGIVYCPAEAVGGDYFDILPHGDHGWLVCIADATDHGVPAAMTAAMLKTLLLQAKENAVSPGEILKNMNRVFMEVNLYGDFASIILLRLDLETRCLTYANAGHDPAWLIESGQVRELEATGTLLGIDEAAIWEDQSIMLTDRTRLAISTDGITETFNNEEMLFGKERLLEMLLEHSSLPAAPLANLVHNRVNEFRGKQSQADDVTLLILDLELKGSPTVPGADDPVNSEVDRSEVDRQENVAD